MYHVLTHFCINVHDNDVGQARQMTKMATAQSVECYHNENSENIYKQGQSETSRITLRGVL